VEFDAEGDSRNMSRNGDSKNRDALSPGAVERSSDAEIQGGLVLRRPSFVAVVQTTELRNRHDAAVAGRRDWSRRGRIFAE
jgi:hypothetical protein